MEHQIGLFSKISKLSIKTLRYYHQINLLVPSRIDKDTGYRYYNDKDFDKATKIEKLKNLDFSLDDIKMILSKYTNDGELSQFMRYKIQNINNKIEYYNEIRNKITRIITQNELLDIQYSNTIKIKEIPNISIISIRYIGNYNDISGLIERIYKSYGKYISSNPFCLYYQSKYNDSKSDIEVCAEVSENIINEIPNFRVLNGGKVVSIIHKGPYENIGNSYKKIIDYLMKNDIEIKFPIREIYLKGKEKILDSNTSEYLTEIQFLI